AFVAADAFYVPTLAAYAALLDEGAAAGMPEASLAKAGAVAEAGADALRLATEAGARIAFGTDLLGSLRARQNEEFALRAKVQDAWQVLRSATTVAAELLGHADELGTLRPGAYADVVLTRHDPTADVTRLADPAGELVAVLAGGRLVADRR